MSGSGISWAISKSAPRSRQITTPTPHHSVFYRLDALPAAQPTASKHIGTLIGILPCESIGTSCCSSERKCVKCVLVPTDYSRRCGSCLHLGLVLYCGRLANTQDYVLEDPRSLEEARCWCGCSCQCWNLTLLILIWSMTAVFPTRFFCSCLRNCGTSSYTIESLHLRSS